jgi:hypothetical protein
MDFQLTKFFGEFYMIFFLSERVLGGIKIQIQFL